MTPSAESRYREISGFINNSPAGLLQVLVAAARRSTFQRIIACPTYPVPVKTAGLLLAVRCLREEMRSEDDHVPTFLARLYALVRALPHRKRLGQFFTAAKVADWAISVAPPLPSDDVCDAGAGTAVFADAILRTGVAVGSYVAVENDAILALCAAHVLESINAPNSYKVWYANFLLLDDAAFRARGVRPPTLIIANPPFVRSRNLTGRARIRTALKSSSGVTPSSLAGSGSYFLSRAAALAGSAAVSAAEHRPNSRLLFFFPKEAAGAAHARRLRNDLQRVHGWTCREYTIPTCQTGVDRHQSNALALFFVFQQKTARVKARTRQSKSDMCVGDVLQIKRGISTGCNEFFVLTDEEVRRRKIDLRFLSAVLPTRIPLKGNNFSKADWDLLRISGLPCWLLSLPNRDLEDLEPPVQEYLKEGLRRGLHVTPTAQRLRTWFSIPVPLTPPDVFVTYLFRGAPRFVRNEASIFHLTNILGGRFVPSIQDPEHRGMVIASLNKQAAHWIEVDKAGREYRGGLRKIEPRELAMLPVDSAIAELVNDEGRAAKATSGSLFD